LTNKGKERRRQFEHPYLLVNIVLSPNSWLGAYCGWGVTQVINEVSVQVTCSVLSRRSSFDAGGVVFS